MYIIVLAQINVTGFCIIFEIEGVECSLYGYLIFTHCGVINTLWGNSIVYQTELLGLSYQSVAENLQVDPSTVCRIVHC